MLWSDPPTLAIYVILNFVTHLRRRLDHIYSQVIYRRKSIKYLDGLYTYFVYKPLYCTHNLTFLFGCNWFLPRIHQEIRLSNLVHLKLTLMSKENRHRIIAFCSLVLSSNRLYNAWHQLSPFNRVCKVTYYVVSRWYWKFPIRRIFSFLIGLVKGGGG